VDEQFKRAPSKRLQEIEGKGICGNKRERATETSLALNVNHKTIGREGEAVCNEAEGHVHLYRDSTIFDVFCD